MRERPKWIDYFFNIAKQVSLRSDCIRNQVGCVIVNSRNKIKGTGYNNSPIGVQSCLSRGYCYRIENNIESGTRYETCRSIHAEQNAIIQVGEENCVGSSMYIYGHKFVCVLCRRFIINAGIEVVYLCENEGSIIDIIFPDIWKGDL